MKFDTYTKFILTVIAIGIFLPHIVNPPFVNIANASNTLTKNDIKEVFESCSGLINNTFIYINCN